MAYQDLINTLRKVAAKVNPNGPFIHGWYKDGSAEYDKVKDRGEGAIPLIHVMPFTSRKINGGKRSVVTVLFLEQDTPQSTSLDREAICGRMEVLSERFEQRLMLEDGIQIDEDSSEEESVEGWYQGYLSGYTLQLQIDHEGVCVDIADYNEADYSEDYNTQDKVQ